MSMFQPRRCGRRSYKFCSNWPQRVQYKGCIPEARTCYDDSGTYELKYRDWAESCKEPGKGEGNVCPYSNQDWARLLNGFTVVDSSPV